jgi:adenine phosphoribosyltransferase
MFRDITTLLKDADGLRDVTKAFVERYKDADIDIIAGIESRGFILGAMVAHQLKKGFIPIRKKGKLPADTVTITYDTEYSTDTIEIHKDAIEPGAKVLLLDDLIATGGSALAAAQLIEKCGGKVIEVGLIVDLPDLKGKKKLEDKGYKVFTLVEFEGE